MFVVRDDPIFIHLGPLALGWYGLAVMAAVMSGVWLTLRESRRRGLPVNVVADLALWVVLGGIVGARLLHVVDRWDAYRGNLLAALAIQSGGLAIQGAIIGGVVVGAIVAWRRGLPVRRLSDAAAPGVVLGQAIGRLGCFFTGDALGPPTGGGWGIMYTNPAAMAPAPGVAYQPVFLYELAWDLLVLGILWPLRTRLHRDGQLFGVYLVLYAAGKFALSFLRTETVWFWGLQEAQLLALGIALAGFAWMWRHGGGPLSPSPLAA